MNFESSALTTPSGVTISGLISQSIASRLDEAPVELLDDRRDLLLLARILDPAGVDEVARDPRLPPLQRVDVQAHERVRVVRGDLLDLDPALRREHEERLLGAAVERDREVVLLRDVGRLLDPDLADDVAANVEPQDLARLLLGVGRVDRRASRRPPCRGRPSAPEP